MAGTAPATTAPAPKKKRTLLDILRALRQPKVAVMLAQCSAVPLRMP